MKNFEKVAQEIDGFIDLLNDKDLSANDGRNIVDTLAKLNERYSDNIPFLENSIDVAYWLITGDKYGYLKSAIIDLKFKLETIKKKLTESHLTDLYEYYKKDFLEEGETSFLGRFAKKNLEEVMDLLAETA